MEWKQADIQRYIDDEIEENLILDYKAADALAKTDGKKKEITKDVSAMANSAGGIIIYGIKEYQDSAKSHLPELIDPIDRTQFSKEWLEQNINNIRPRIDAVVVYPVDLPNSPNDVAYVVEIPQSHTAHQATDHRYYKRFNFMSVPMEDHEVRDVMNRATVPDVSVEFSFELKSKTNLEHEYNLRPIVKNLGEQVVNNFKLTIIAHNLLRNNSFIGKNECIKITNTQDARYIFSYQSMTVFFPKEEKDLGYEFQYRYRITPETWMSLRSINENERNIRWILYADDMPPKQGEITFSEIQEFGTI